MSTNQGQLTTSDEATPDVRQVLVSCVGWFRAEAREKKTRGGKLRQIPRVFLAAPFAQWMSSSPGMMDQARRDELDALRCGLLQAGASVFNAHFNEAWGSGWLPPAVCVPNDFRALQTCDLVCAYLGTPASVGVAVELGWASAMHKPILLVLDADSEHSQMITGLPAITTVRQLILPGGWGAGVASLIKEAAVSMLSLLDGTGRAAWRGEQFDECLGYVTSPAAEILGATWTS